MWRAMFSNDFVVDQDLPNMKICYDNFARVEASNGYIWENLQDTKGIKYLNEISVSIETLRSKDLTCTKILKIGSNVQKFKV